jgi:hypothetical protein
MSLLSRCPEVTMSVSRRCLSTFLLLLACGSFAAAQPPAPGTLPKPADKLLIVVSTKDDEAANVFLAANDRLDLLKSIKTGAGPQEVAVSPDGTKAYVTHHGQRRCDGDRYSDADGGNDLQRRQPAARPTGRRSTSARADPRRWWC